MESISLPRGANYEPKPDPIRRRSPISLGRVYAKVRSIAGREQFSCCGKGCASVICRALDRQSVSLTAPLENSFRHSSRDPMKAQRIPRRLNISQFRPRYSASNFPQGYFRSTLSPRLFKTVLPAEHSCANLRGQPRIYMLLNALLALD